MAIAAKTSIAAAEAISRQCGVTRFRLFILMAIQIYLGSEFQFKVQLVNIQLSFRLSRLT